MANEEQLSILKQGVEAWNEWREENPSTAVDLEEADISEIDLGGIVLGGAFCNVNLIKANLNRAQLFRANLEGADLRRASLIGADLNHAVLDGAKLIEANLSQADCLNISLTKADLTKANLSDAHLLQANLSGANFRDANLQGADLRKAWMRETNLSGADLSGTGLTGIDLREVNLSNAKLYKAYLQEVNLTGTNLKNVDLRQADLSLATLHRADLRNANLSFAKLPLAKLDFSNLEAADLRGADLWGATLVRARIHNAKISGSSVYGINVWDLIGEFKEQKDLMITDHHGLPTRWEIENDQMKDHRVFPTWKRTVNRISISKPRMITVDNIEVAQFIYLILDNKKIRDVINTLTSKAVLILGRFALAKRKTILDALKNKLREYDLIPIVFDFDRPTDKDFTETIKILAGLSYFVIADITNPKSSPLELQATIPDYQIPFVPIIQEGEKPFAMMVDLQKKYDWVLDTLSYRSKGQLIEVLKSAIIDPAIQKHNELRLIKAREPKIRSANDFIDDKGME